MQERLKVYFESLLIQTFWYAKQYYIVLSRQGVLVSACAVFTSFTSRVIRSKSPESQSKVADFLDSKNYQSNHQKFQILFHLSDRFLLSCRGFQLIMSKEYYKGNVISSLLYRQVLFKFSGCYLSFQLIKTSCQQWRWNDRTSSDKQLWFRVWDIQYPSNINIKKLIFRSKHF